MDGMPGRSSLRRRAPWALVPVAAMLLLTGCGLDGSDPGVKALVPSTTAGPAGGPNQEMAPEQDHVPLANP